MTTNNYRQMKRTSFWSSSNKMASEEIEEGAVKATIVKETETLSSNWEDTCIYLTVESLQALSKEICLVDIRTEEEKSSKKEEMENEEGEESSNRKYISTFISALSLKSIESPKSCSNSKIIHKNSSGIANTDLLKHYVNLSHKSIRGQIEFCRQNLKGEDDNLSVGQHFDKFPILAPISLRPFIDDNIIVIFASSQVMAQDFANMLILANVPKVAILQ